MCVFTTVCAACIWAEGRTAHQPIHRTAQCFLGGGRASEREGSKKSSENYPQLWTLLCHLLLRRGKGAQMPPAAENADGFRRAVAASAVFCSVWDQIFASAVGVEWVCVCVGGGGVAATWAKARVIGSRLLNPYSAGGPCSTSPFEGCSIVAWEIQREVWWAERFCCDKSGMPGNHLFNLIRAKREGPDLSHDDFKRQNKSRLMNGKIKNTDCFGA